MVATVLPSLGYAQMSGGGGVGGVPTPGTSFGGATDPSMLQPGDGFRITPSIMIGQRYDTNVYYAPKTPGLDSSDFVTTMAPQIRSMYGSDLGILSVMAGAVGEYYAKNTELNYVGTNASGIVDLSKLLSRWHEGIRLRAFSAYTYTPNPPAFLAGDLSGQPDNPYVRGFQAGRVNLQTLFNNASLSVPLSAVVNLTGSYSGGFMKYGEPTVAQVGTLLDTIFHTYRVGLSQQMTSQDTATLVFFGSEYDYDYLGSYTSRGGAVGWSRAVTPTVGITTELGAQLLQGKLSGAAFSGQVGPTGNLTLNMNDQSRSVLIAYNIGITPSFQFQAEPLLTQVATVTLVQKMGSPELSGLLSANYGRGDQYRPISTSTGASSVSYTSWGGSVGLVYQYRQKTFIGLNYMYSDYETSFGGAVFHFDKHVCQVTISQAFY